MTQNDKIKRLIEKYKDAHLRAPSNQARTIFEYMIEDLQALLDKECEHTKTSIKRHGIFALSLVKVCDNCNKILDKS